jgi:hypothetical protein
VLWIKVLTRLVLFNLNIMTLVVCALDAIKVWNTGSEHGEGSEPKEEDIPHAHEGR